MIKKPPYRKLRGYAFDPSLSLRLDTAVINQVTYKIPWEEPLSAGPLGEYVEVVDYDPTVNKWYQPVDLNNNYLLAQDGLEPGGGNPQFHQQMVYAVAMTTINNFETALGRPVLWSPRRIRKETVITTPSSKTKRKTDEEKKVSYTDEFVKTLRIYPHALREANAFYSPQKKALLFGYFSAQPAENTLQMPDNLTFTCLSHDIIAHETTHAILDGLYRKYTDNTNPDVLAFHEAFSDIVALFQHFTFPEVLKNQIAATRGDLASQNLLGKLAQEFGIAIGNYGSLRDAIGEYNPHTKQWTPKEPNGEEYRTIMEPHKRGAILVSAVFDAFLTIYKSRITDLLRIATNGSGILPQGELNPDLVNRLAAEASKSSGHVLKMCIRALDYCPPVDITFGDYLRAIITADTDLVADDDKDYRIAFIDAFRKRGIYPSGVRNLSVESLSYTVQDNESMTEQIKILTEFLRKYRTEITYLRSREDIFNTNKKFIAGDYESKNKIFGLHRRLHSKFKNSLEFEIATGLLFSEWPYDLGVRNSDAYNVIRPSFEVHSLNYAARISPSGRQLNQVVVTLLQKAALNIEKEPSGSLKVEPDAGNGKFVFTGGATLIFDLDTLKLKYVISKPLLDVVALKANGDCYLNNEKIKQVYKHQNHGSHSMGMYEAYFGMKGQAATGEPFAFLHTH